MTLKPLHGLFVALTIAAVAASAIAADWGSAMRRGDLGMGSISTVSTDKAISLMETYRITPRGQGGEDLLEGLVKNMQPEHSLSRMRDAEIAFRVLTRDETEKVVSLCICCRNHRTPLCPHQRQEKIGVCDGYTLDERDPLKTESRVIAFLQGHHHS